MKLYIGNSTRQTHRFAYRMLGETKVIHVTIPHGAQVQITGDFQPEEIDHIVKQHTRYGLVSADEISRIKAYHGLCYALNKPIPSSKLTYLVEHNIGELDEQGREFRRIAAIAGNNTVARVLRESGRPEQVKQFDLTIQEDRQDSSLRTPQLSDQFSVINNPDAPAPVKRRPAA